MASTIALLAVVALLIVTTLLLWRGNRRVSTVGQLKNFSVSRQWLAQHQSDE
jgi:hypothetical protein